MLNLKGRYYRWFPAEAHQGYAEEVLEVHPDETAFVMVDG